MGTETAIPSGMLWMAMANTMGRAMSMFVNAEAKSGQSHPEKLCTPMAKRHQYARAFERGRLTELLVGVYLVGVFIGRDQPVDQSNQADACKRKDNNMYTSEFFLGIKCRSNKLDRLRHQFHE